MQRSLTRRKIIGIFSALGLATAAGSLGAMRAWAAPLPQPQGKVIRRTKKYKAHDATNACGVGDRVLLMETRPLSATKRWRVAEILEKAK